MPADWENFEASRSRKLQRELKDKYDLEHGYGKHAPKFSLEGSIPARLAGEPNASAKQRKYLRALGIHDKVLLDTLGKAQASALISATLKARGELKKSVGTLKIIGIILVLVIIGLIAWAA